MKRAQIHEMTERLGFQLEVTSPGDSRARYTFLDREDRPVLTCKGRKEALIFLAGLEAGVDRDLRPEEAP